MRAHPSLLHATDAVNAMQYIKATERALTESFRFGPTFAALASQVLKLLGETTPVRGQQSIVSTLVEDAAARPKIDAILCRKNVTVIGELANGLTAGHKVAVRANIDEILAFADAADRLMNGQRAYKPTALALFESWSDVQEYARSHAGRDLLPVVQIIDREGTDYLRQLLSSVTKDESQADYVVSTVHRAKGLEWDRVKVTGDFRFKVEDDGRTTLADDEKRLLYVALTRARRLLDVSELRA
jgi:superfamily I DNA/RNA helicase